MKIVVLDGYALNPGDLSWAPLQELGELKVYDRTPRELVLERAGDADAVLVNKVALNAEVIGKLPRLRYIGVLATGFDVVDLKAARDRGIPVTNVPGYSTRSVAQMVFALLLELTQQVGHHDRLVREEGRWSDCPDFCFWDRPLLELDGRTMGIVGFGRIGRQVAAIARAFGMKVVVHTAHPDKYRDLPEGRAVRFLELDSLFAESDVVSLHCPLSAKTERLVDERRLGLMKPNALLINAARGPLLDEKAVADALERGRLGGLGADVLGKEPPRPDNLLLKAPKVVLTPHIAWATREARTRLLHTVVENLRAFQEGRSLNVVN
ncbi:MAG: D-2-hydroxyacid dehydrogenase [Syntrophotaleaceae bacterium]